MKWLMKTLYWLPCTCGQKYPVETTQAGDTVQCACGAELKVPALREMSQLESAVTAKPGPTRRGKPGWGKRQARLLVGVLVTVAALVALICLELSRPRLANVKSLAPIQVWALWQNARRGPDRHLTPAEQQVVDTLGICRVAKVALLVCAVMGLLWTSVGYVIPAPTRPRSMTPNRRKVPTDTSGQTPATHRSS